MTPQEQEQTNPMFHYFQMEDLVPEDHILRQIDEAVDFSFCTRRCIRLLLP